MALNKQTIANLNVQSSPVTFKNMGKWITDKWPAREMVKTEVLCKLRYYDGSEAVRIGYMKYDSGTLGVKPAPYWIVPNYEGEPLRHWEVIGWMKLPK